MESLSIKLTSDSLKVSIILVEVAVSTSITIVIQPIFELLINLLFILIPLSTPGIQIPGVLMANNWHNCVRRLMKAFESAIVGNIHMLTGNDAIYTSTKRRIHLEQMAEMCC